MTYYEYVLSYFRYLQEKNIIRVIMRYRRKFKNYLHIVSRHKRREYPIEAILKNGSRIVLNNQNHLYAILQDLDYDISHDIVRLDFKNHKLKIQAGIDNGDVIGIFYNDCYRFLPVEDKIVVDIGANIADSSIYFACKNSLKVIAIEPYLKNFEIAERNILTNSLAKQIDLHLAGCSNKSGSITLDDKSEGNVFTALQLNKSGRDVPLLTLKDILRNYNLDSAILKLDCEGSEYAIIMDAARDTLKRFSHIQIEYHYGYQNLCKKLEGCGFHTSISKPIHRPNRHALEPAMKVGWIYADLIL